jgi:hypothetical protein
MKKIAILFSAAVLLWTAPACTFLDVVPEDRPKEEDAFKDVDALRRYLYACYGALPSPHHCELSEDLYTSDETVLCMEHEDYHQFLRGLYSSGNTTINSVLTWKTLPQGIMQCYLLLENADKVPGVTEKMLREYTGHATFLIAYFHFMMLRSYGPIILQGGKSELSLPQADFPARTSYDECVTWIAAKFDEAVAKGLPVTLAPEEYGLANVATARAIKARMLLYAASPLFNGGKAYYTPDGDPHVTNYTTGTDDLSNTWNGFKNKDGGQLISSTYDPSKWERARDAAWEAVQAAEAAGFVLYRDEHNLRTEMPFPTNAVERRLRLFAVDKANTNELLWVDARNSWNAINGYGLQNKCAPGTNNALWAMDGLGPSLTMVETFYTENGLPITEDRSWSGFANPYAMVSNTTPAPATGIPAPAQAHYTGAFPGTTLRPLNNTLALNLGREPRFKAWVAYHGSYYEYNTPGNTHTQGLIAVGFRKYDNCGKKSAPDYYPPSGYLNKKGQNPLNSYGGASGGSVTGYPWSLIRLAEVYLNYAEACVETGGSDLDKAIEYINKIRDRAGIPLLDDAWRPTGKTLNQDLLRRIVRQERTIELYLENHRFWDIRRWLLGTKYNNVPARGMAFDEDDDAGFLKVVNVIQPRSFNNNFYLMPIPIDEINKNTKLVQNPGY